MHKTGLQQVYLNTKSEVLNFLENLKKIDRKRIKKILMIGSMVVVVLIGSLVILNNIDCFNILELFKPTMTNDKVIEGAKFVSNNIVEGANFIPVPVEEIIVEGTDFSKAISVKPEGMIDFLISKLKFMKY